MGFYVSLTALMLLVAVLVVHILLLIGINLKIHHLHHLKKNNYSVKTNPNGGGGDYVKDPHFSTCEEVVHKMAIAAENKKISKIVALIPKLCPTCRKELTKLFTAEFL